jgi:sulfur carrier protein ThiS
MIITVEHSAVLRLKNIKSRGELNVPEDITITALLNRLGIQAGQHKYLLTYVNGTKRGLNHILHDGDALQLFLPIGGG